MPLPAKDPDVTYLGERYKEKPEVRDYLAGVKLIDDTVAAIRSFGPHAKPAELQRLRETYLTATIRCSALLTLIEQRYLSSML